MIKMSQNNLDTATNKKVATGFASLQLVTSACHSVLNTNFTPLTPKPDWYDALSSELDVAKVLSQQWIDDLAPKMTSSIPTHVLNYSPTYKAMTDQILELINKDPTAKGKDNKTVQQVFALIDALQASVDDIIKDVLSTEQSLKDWGDKMQKAHDDLYNGAANIQKAEVDIQSDINKMNAAITSLRSMIDAENKAIAYSGIAIGVGLFALVAGIALAFVTFGAGLVVAGIGVAGIVGGAVTWGVMQAKINSQMDEIAKDQKELTDDNRQLVALQGLSLSANMAVSSIETATNALSEVRTMWATFKGELQGVVDKLNKADEELYMVVNKGYIIAAQSEWDLAIEFAQQLVGMKIDIQTKTVPMSA